MEDTNQNNNPEVNEQPEMNKNSETNQNPERKEKKFSWAKIVVPIIIVVILAAFAGVIYYAKVIKPDKDIDKSIGYKPEDYIVLGKYTGFDYEITQAEYDSCVSEETNSYASVKRAAKDTDQVDFNYTGYVDGKVDKNLTQKDCEIIIGQEEDFYKEFSKAIIGHKAGETVKVKSTNATALSEDGSDYSNKTVEFSVKITSVGELVVDEVTDKWVKENYYDDYGLKTKSDFYTWCKEYVEQTAHIDVWQKAVEKATMNSYPQEVYDDIVTEFTEDANYYAETFNITSEEYLKGFCGYTDKTLEEEYLNQVKSELVMWAIVKKQNLKANDEEIESKYEELYQDCGYDTVEEMKKNYKKSEIEEAVLLDKAQNYVYDNSNIKESFKQNK